MTVRDRKPAKNVIAALHAAHWAILPESLTQMMEIAARTMDEPITTIEALEAKIGKQITDTGGVTLRDGVATISVSGPLFRYANLFTMLSGATSYETLSTDLQQALDNSQVRSIILSIDSPGGEVNGNAELSQMVYDARGRKPIVAYISHMGASAAYWLASAAQEVVVDPTSLVGSIGTVISIADRSAADAAKGVKTIEIVSSQSPKKRMAATSSEGQSALQTIVDDIASVFVEAVARNRGVSVDTVLSEFGQGGVLVGAAAVDQGLADRLGSYEALHTELASGKYSKPARPAARSNTSANQEQEMKVDATAAVATDTNPAAPATPPATPPAAAAATPPADPPATPATTEAAVDTAAAIATAERERIEAIDSIAPPGMDALIAECKADPKCTPEMAALKILRAEGSARTARLRSLAADDAQLPKPGPAAPAASDPNSASAVARRVIAAHEKVTSPNRSK